MTSPAGTPTRAAFVHCPEIERYPYPPNCPFSTARAGLARKTVASMGLLSGPHRREVAPAPADRGALLEFHTARYLDALQAAEAGHLGVDGLGMGIGTDDTPVFKGMVAYASLACGASLKAAGLIDAGEADVAFNPSGGFHHARAATAAGFCYVNDIALACLHLAGAGKRVVFLDVDAHHGDGVQDAFYSRPDVLTISFHESGKTLFPGTGWPEEIGVGDGTGYSVNVPLPPGTHDEAFMRAFDAVAVPLIGAYGPDVIVLELGLDGLAGDPLAHLSLTNNAYADVAEQVLGVGRPILATGGGGYHVENTARGWALAWSVLCGADDGPDGLNVGLGGVMLETTDWQGGLRDRHLAPDASQRDRIVAEIDATVEQVKANVFPHHGL